ncbi:MAG TPA: 16S rRNA (cytosine(1402)-N(4))-methyltransferase RsmH [Dictyoglomaceae bacterium]|nr:16S rRNA (cytosine(1402)-N(4))-methyltransferase RsmH [Dictyoglomaceae bacterium]HOL38869.1 16S rRNA (cytosine(1402)-N(4))-methyltransferase RsmH [Dictyoglomaceae bacterium]HOP95396.1 16S rRNA (cytosine(1402)-N(4))-methyltransferase RsmH [Dictyoglomaceae bacterium]HPP15714.1 16S rRNA (cytosine(1402)-N(4))-methyltransferase RsmH [Dictyoglomaceae bacterium]HPU44093.1 16S rRNA (cytosine(1402)-N(4))-methyltransferase RsmH [Dictyoglomaceae bacterium]
MEEVVYIHKPVMLEKVMEYLQVTPGKIIVDATIGLGGHSTEILKALKNEGLLIGIDRDEESLSIAEERLRKIAKNFKLYSTTYDYIPKILEDLNIQKVDGILFDLGFSSFHIEESGRGFSFQRLEEPLDMRFSKGVTKATAADILNNFSEKELEDIFKNFGEEPYAKKIAKAVVEKRREKPFSKVNDLVELIEKIVPRSKKHPATRVFQALRIAVNDELKNLEKALSTTHEILNLRGRVVFLTYHSLEDRIVKTFLKQNQDKFYILTKKVAKPSFEEVRNNPRARSAKLRAGERREVK